MYSHRRGTGGAVPYRHSSLSRRAEQAGTQGPLLNNRARGLVSVHQNTGFCPFRVNFRPLRAAATQRPVRAVTPGCLHACASERRDAHHPSTRAGAHQDTLLGHKWPARKQGTCDLRESARCTHRYPPTACPSAACPFVYQLGAAPACSHPGRGCRLESLTGRCT